jgi:hypothetical protein
VSALADILRDRTGAPVPAESWTAHLEDHGDIKIFVGHIDQAEADRRLAARNQALSGLETVRGDVTHRWAVIERHDEDCDALSSEVAIGGDPGDLCACDEPWYPRWVESGTPGAVAVTTAFADQPAGGAR